MSRLDILEITTEASALPKLVVKSMILNLMGTLKSRISGIELEQMKIKIVVEVGGGINAAL